MKKSCFLILIFLILTLSGLDIDYEKKSESFVSGTYETINSDSHLIIEPPYAYIPSRYGLEIATYNEETGSIEDRVSITSLKGILTEIIKIDNYIYATTYYVNKAPEQYSFFKIDVSEVNQPVKIDSISLDGNYNYLDVDIVNNHLTYIRQQAYYTSTQELVFLDNNSLTELASLPIINGYSTLNDTLLLTYAGEEWEIYDIYNISDIYNLELITEIDLTNNPLSGTDQLKEIGDNLAIQRSTDGLAFWDYSDLYNWNLLSIYEPTTQDLVLKHFLQMDNHILLPNWGYGVEVVDISDPENPTFLEYEENPDPVSSGNPLVAYGNEVYLGSSYRGIVHGSLNSGNFQYIDSYHYDSRILSAAYYNDYLYLGRSGQGLSICELSDSEPTIIETINDSISTLDCQIAGDKLYISSSYCYKLYSLVQAASPEYITSFYWEDDTKLLFTNESEDNILYTQNGDYYGYIKKFSYDNNGIYLLWEFPIETGNLFSHFRNNYAYFIDKYSSGFQNDNLLIYSGFAGNEPELSSNLVNFFPDDVNYLQAVGEYLAASLADMTIHYYSLENPLEPTPRFYTEMFGKSYTDGELLFVVGSCLVAVYDISNNPEGLLVPIDFIILNSEAYQLIPYEVDGTKNLIVVQNECVTIYEYNAFSGFTNNEVNQNNFVLNNYPNPFNPNTVISFQMSDFSGQNLDEAASIEIYNVKGQKVKSYKDLQGKKAVVWHGKDESGKAVGSGVYFYQLQRGEEVLASRKMTLMK